MQMENLDRGMVAVGDSGGKVYLVWRLLKAASNYRYGSYF